MWLKKSTILILLFVHGNGTELFNRLSKCITTKKTKMTYLCLNPNIIVTKHKYFILCYVTVGKGDIKVSGLCEIVALQLLVWRTCVVWRGARLVAWRGVWRSTARENKPVGRCTGGAWHGSTHYLCCHPFTLRLLRCGGFSKTLDKQWILLMRNWGALRIAFFASERFNESNVNDDINT